MRFAVLVSDYTQRSRHKSTSWVFILRVDLISALDSVKDEWSYSAGLTLTRHSDGTFETGTELAGRVSLACRTGELGYDDGPRYVTHCTK